MHVYSYLRYQKNYTATWARNRYVMSKYENASSWKVNEKSRGVYLLDWQYKEWSSTCWLCDDCNVFWINRTKWRIPTIFSDSNVVISIVLLEGFAKHMAKLTLSHKCHLKKLNTLHHMKFILKHQNYVAYQVGNINAPKTCTGVLLYMLHTTTCAEVEKNCLKHMQ